MRNALKPGFLFLYYLYVPALQTYRTEMLAFMIVSATPCGRPATLSMTFL